MYDEIWLFGFEASYTGMPGRGEFLAPAEIAAIHAHMQRGGGLFAAGDHGDLGRALCGGLSRVRGMRHWRNFPSINESTSEVSMDGQYRNNTNQVATIPKASLVIRATMFLRLLNWCSIMVQD